MNTNQSDDGIRSEAIAPGASEVADAASPQPPGPPFDAGEAAIALRLERLSSPAVALPLIIVAGLLLFIVNLGGAPLYTKGEPREAVTVFDIVHGGGVILPMRAGVEIPSKPLLMHWLAAIASVIAGGVSAWTVRLPSALGAIAGMVATYLYVRKLFEARAALIAAIMLGTTFQYMQAGTGSRVDMTLTFFMTVAFFEFLVIAEGLGKRTTLLYLAIALAVLTKGPIGAALPGLVALVWIGANRRWSLLRRLRLEYGAVIVGVIGGGWYLAAIVSGGAAFVHKQILGENLYRLIGHAGVNQGHAHPFYYEEGALLAGFLPWTPIALIAALQALRHRRRLDPRLGYLVAWFLTVLIFYNLPQSKRGAYLLALYPALATMIALFLSDAISHREAAAAAARRLARAYGALFAAAGAGALMGLALLFAAPAVIQWILARCGIVLEQLPAALRIGARSFWPLAIALPLMVAALGICLMQMRPRVENVFGAIAAAFVAVALAVTLVVEPAVANTLTLKGFALETMKLAGAQAVGYWGSLDYDFAFYSGRNIAFVTTPGAQFPFVVSSEDDYKLMWPSMRARYQTVLRSGPTDFDGTGQMILLKRIDAAAAPERTPPATRPPSQQQPKPAA